VAFLCGGPVTTLFRTNVELLFTLNEDLMTTNQDQSKPTVTLSPVFLQEMQALAQAEAKFHAGETKPVPFSREREQHLGIALRELAASYGVRLEGPFHIDTNGEYRVVALPEGKDSAKMGCGHYGEAFAALLNPHRPRQGAMGYPPATLHADSGWCYVNHFEIERLLKEQAAAVTTAQAG
jgi:hypothetical protein